MIFLSLLTLCNTTSFLTRSVQLISILLQHHISKHSRYFLSTFGIITLLFSTAHNYGLNISPHIIVIFSTLDLVFYPEDGGSTLLRNSGTSPQIYTSSCCCVPHYLCSRSLFVCLHKLMAKQTTSKQLRPYCMLHVQNSVLLALNALHITSIDLYALLLIRFLVHKAFCVSHVTFSHFLLLLRHHKQMWFLHDNRSFQEKFTVVTMQLFVFLT